MPRGRERRRPGGIDGKAARGCSRSPGGGGPVHVLTADAPFCQRDPCDQACAARGDDLLIRRAGLDHIVATLRRYRRHAASALTRA